VFNLRQWHRVYTISFFNVVDSYIPLEELLIRKSANFHRDVEWLSRSHGVGDHQSAKTMKIDNGKFKESEQTYQKDLSIWRDNGWSLYGLSKALEAQGKSDEAMAEMAKFKRV